MPTDPHRRAQIQIDLLIALAIVCITGPIIQEWTAQPASRYSLTAAIVDDHSLELDPYEGVLGPDQAAFDGHIYSDKAPYQSFLGAPPYALFRVVGGKPFPVVDGQQVVNRSTHLGLWWVTFWTATVPAILLTVVVRRLVMRVDPTVATAVAIAVTLGTTMLPFTSWLFGHVLAALSVALAWILLRPDGPSRRASLAAGLCLGMGIGTEYTVAVIALLLLIESVWRRRWAQAGWLSVGTLTATIPLMIYNWRVFENPFEVSYQGHLPNFRGSGAFGVFNLTAPQGEEVARALIGDRGLFVLTPVMVLALLGCGLAIARGGVLRRDGVLGIVALVLFLVVSTGIDGLGGDSPGPRYLIPMFPLLAVPLAVTWRRLPLPCTLAACVGGVTMFMAAVTNPDIASTEPNALGTWAKDLANGDMAVNILTGRDHRSIILFTALAGVTAIAAAVRIDRREVHAPS
jgi:hypothetical protein